MSRSFFFNLPESTFAWLVPVFSHVHSYYVQLLSHGGVCRVRSEVSLTVVTLANKGSSVLPCSVRFYTPNQPPAGLPPSSSPLGQNSQDAGAPSMGGSPQGFAPSHYRLALPTEGKHFVLPRHTCNRPSNQAVKLMLSIKKLLMHQCDIYTVWVCASDGPSAFCCCCMEVALVVP